MKRIVDDDQAVRYVTRGGVTLLEVVCALALAAILLASLNGVVHILADQQRIAAQIDDQSWVRRLGSRIESDVLHATRYEVIPDGFSLRGRLGRDVDGKRSLQPRSVDYFVRAKGAASALYRVEQQDQGQRRRVELLAVGIRGLLVGHEDDQLQNLIRGDLARPGWYDIPESFRVLLIGTSQGKRDSVVDTTADAAVILDLVTKKPRFDR